MLLKQSYRLAADSLLNGLSKTEACRKAGFKQPKQAGARIFDREDVQLYIKQKQAKLSAKHDVERDDIIRWCLGVLELNPLDAMTRDEKGVMRLDPGAVNAASEALFKSGVVNYTDTESGRKITSVAQIKGLDAMKRFAIQTLCSMMGFFDNTIEVKGELSLAENLLRGRKRVETK